MRRAGGGRSPAASRCCTARSTQIVQGVIARKKFVIVCTNALLLEKKIDLFKPQHVLHLVGPPRRRRARMHDKSVCQDGVYDRAVAAIKPRQVDAASASTSTARCSTTPSPERVAAFFDDVMAMGVDGITVSPGYAYERAPDQQHFLNRRKTKQLFRDIFARGRAARSGRSTSRPCSSTSWPATRPTTARRGATRRATYFGWQRPCYLLGEGYAKTFKELMEDTDWDSYGTGNYEKCADCMVHCGYEATAVSRDDPTPVEGARRRRCAASAPTARWRRRSRSSSSARPNTCSAPTSNRR